MLELLTFSTFNSSFKGRSLHQPSPMKWRHLLSLPEKFRKLEDRLPQNLIQAKKTIESSQEREKERERRVKEWEDFKVNDLAGLVFLYLFVNAIGPIFIFFLGLPVWTWILVGSFWCLQIVANGYFEIKKYIPDDNIGEVLIVPKLIYPNVETNWIPSSHFSSVMWRTFGFFHWIYRYTQALKLRAQEIEKPKELLDERLPTLCSFFHNMEARDQTVKITNRLIDQVELKLIPLEDITKLITDLRSDEKYLMDLMEYTRRLLLEGPLGTSIETNRSADEIVDAMDGRLSEIVKHQEELREFSGKIAARMEVSSR
ncbi:MAG: hypothetical protein UT30_C0003G0013 [Candidatus Uhrbacteria bacterium GW2011_GWF2_39_13]|uniref:Uncharacterized protein n=1 Tax=Candidatus Uhrbacteria bacterium GW2011_GWF2_39_13 TaxID=1618995 RepID=A0A0G0MLD5_9BACT|nr:MAG: hypothetical protein UT30_C0003G0013 [Candidatus Uhrbacteria bacterium GW2011_GWF2_39_13]